VDVDDGLKGVIEQLDFALQLEKASNIHWIQSAFWTATPARQVSNRIQDQRIALSDPCEWRMVTGWQLPSISFINFHNRHNACIS
jgi:hypothetical protein